MQSPRPINLLSIGNTIVDIEYQVNESTLTEFGIEKGSMTLIDNDKCDALQASLGPPIHRCNGGSAANSLFVAKQLGMTVHHFGVVGSDALSDFVIDDYTASGIHHSFDITKTKGDTGCCLVLITPDGERTMLTHLGVSNQFNTTDPLHHLIPSATQLLIEGYLLADDACFSHINTSLIPQCKVANTRVALTLSDAGLVGFFKAQFEALVHQQLDMIFCNYQEASALSGSTTMDDIAAYFSPRCQETIITDGDNGATIVTSKGITHCPTTPVKPVDTTGAGDAFAGTYMSQRHQHSSIASAAEKANDICRIVVSCFGARPSDLVKAVI